MSVIGLIHNTSCSTHTRVRSSVAGYTHSRQVVKTKWRRNNSLNVKTDLLNPLDWTPMVNQSLGWSTTAWVSLLLARMFLWPWMNSTSLHNYVEQPRQNEPPSVFSQARLEGHSVGHKFSSFDSWLFLKTWVCLVSNEPQWNSVFLWWHNRLVFLESLKKFSYFLTTKYWNLLLKICNFPS